MQAAPQPKFSKRYDLVTEEKAGGVTYTPSGLADFVADQIVQSADLSGASETLRILDPAVGDGALLFSLLERLQGRVNLPISVYGFDTDQKALAQASRRLASAFPSATLHLEKGNFLEYVLAQANPDAPSLFNSTEAPKFDLIIANPPYVRTQIMGAKQAQSLAEAFGLSGRVDLYYAFLIGIAQVLRSGGIAGVIVSNRFMTTKGGASVRQALRTRFALRHVWDLGDTKLFDAAVLPAVILAEGRNGHESSSPAFTSIYETGGEPSATASDPITALAHNGVVATDDGRRFQVQHGILDTSGGLDAVWRVATGVSDSWLATVATHTWGTFRDIGKIRVGVKTCADKVFIRKDWQKLPSEMQPELLRSLTTHHIARRFKAMSSDHPRSILYPHEVIQGRRSAIDLGPYPRSLAYLEAHRSILEGRSYVLEAGRKWYEIWVPQDPEAWSATKLVFRDISEVPTFWIDQSGSIVNGDCYWMIAEKSGTDELLWLAAAVANSTFIEAFYDHRFNNKLYGGRRRYITQYVEQFPLPDPESSVGREIITLAQTLYSVVDAPEAGALEDQLNRLVWKAFGLPIEEVPR